MGKYKYLRRKRKIIKIGKKLGVAAIFLVVSYLLSIFSFYIYTELSQILLPENKGFLGFAVIGLVAGFIAILVSLVNKRLILTIIISFFIDCLVDSVLLFSKLGIQVAQFLPGLLVSMSAVIASWNFLKRKLWLSKYYSKTTQSTKEQVSNKYALARKLIEDPNKITLEVFKEVCDLLQGIDPKIDSVLKKAEYVSQALTFIKGGDAIGFALYNIKVKTEKDKEKKEKLLFFIDLVNDIREEVGTAIIRLDTARGVDNIGHQGSMATIAASGPSSIASITMTIVAATTVVAAGTVGIIPGSSLLPKNESQMPNTQNSQEMNTPTQTETLRNLPTDIPKIEPTLTFSTIEKTIFVSALEEGTMYNAPSTGTYRFTITGGAYLADTAKGWEAKVMVYKNRPIDWSGPNGTHTNWDYLVGFPGDRNPEEKLTREEAEQLGKGQSIDIVLNKDEYLIFIVFDSKGDFVDNSGGMYVQIQKGTLITSTVSTITLDNGWGHFARIFNGPPGPDTTSTIDYSVMAMYITVRNNGTTEDRIIGGASSYCTSITFDDMSIYGPDGTISSINIPAKSTVVMDFMKAGRIICNGAKEGLKQGDRITMSLIFEKSGQIPVLIEIRATPE